MRSRRRPFLFKQWGAWKEFAHDQDGPEVEDVEVGTDAAEIYADAVPAHRRAFVNADGHTFHGHHEALPDGRWRMVERIGKSAAGRTLDGVIHDGYPEARP